MYVYDLCMCKKLQYLKLCEEHVITNQFVYITILTSCSLLCLFLKPFLSYFITCIQSNCWFVD